MQSFHSVQYILTECNFALCTFLQLHNHLQDLQRISCPAHPPYASLILYSTHLVTVEGDVGAWRQAQRVELLYSHTAQCQVALNGRAAGLQMSSEEDYPALSMEGSKRILYSLREKLQVKKEQEARGCKFPVWKKTTLYHQHNLKFPLWSDDFQPLKVVWLVLDQV